MNYELVKQLKDAGFPQRQGIDGTDLKGQIYYGFPVYGCSHSKTHPK